MKIRFHTVALVSSALAFSTWAQGNLTPPGAPAPIFKTLDQVEPRTPISSIPIGITNSGSYYLTTNLTSATFGISLRSGVNDVTIDLNGFALAGTSNTPNSGISAPSSTNVTIINGTIRNWELGVSLGPQSRLERLRILENRGGGASVGNNSVIRQCTVMNNVGSSISPALNAGPNSLVEDCVVNSNATPSAIKVFGSSTVTRCLLVQNTGVGIVATSSECVISYCHLAENSLDGIQVANRNLVAGNAIVGPGTSLGTNACIHATLDSNRIEDNHVSDHQVGIRVEGTSSLIIRNSAAFNGTNYVIAASNQVGPTNSGVGVVTNHPWANFSD